MTFLSEFMRECGAPNHAEPFFRLARDFAGLASASQRDSGLSVDLAARDSHRGAQQVSQDVGIHSHTLRPPWRPITQNKFRHRCDAIVMQRKTLPRRLWKFSAYGGHPEFTRNWNFISVRTAKITQKWNSISEWILALALHDGNSLRNEIPFLS